MMSSSRVTRPMRSVRSASLTKKSAIARPIPILTMCCFRTALSGLQKEFHLDASKLYDIVVFEGVWRGADLGAVDRRALVAFDVGDEVALRAARQHSDLDARFAERGERLGELELLARVPAGEQLDRAQRLGARLGRGRACWRGLGGCVLVGDTGRLRARSCRLHCG